MKLFSLLSLFILFQLHLSAQNPSIGNYLKLSGASTAFGTGGAGGFGVYVEGSGNLIKKNKYLSEHIQIGGEIYFENGATNPPVLNPTDEEWNQGGFFYHSSLTALHGKINFYPFSLKILNGLNIGISAGPAYYFFSYESRAVQEEITPTDTRRMSELRLEHEFMWGYRISAGYDFLIKKKILLGFRMDLSNYTNGDFNNSIGGKIGYRFN